MTEHTVPFFNWVDYTILGIIALSLIISFFRGFLREAISLTVWAIGILVALKFAAPLQVYFESWIDSPTIRYTVAFILIFLVVFIIGIFFNMLVHAMVKKSGLSITDRLLGIVFGMVRGVAIVAVLLMFVSAGNDNDESTFTQSRLAPKFAPLVTWLDGFLPQQIRHVSRWVTGEERKSKININLNGGS